jgi:anthranilate/para-aminobenzoate synthase component II
MRVGRYHSLAIDEATLPPTLIATAYTCANNDDSQTVKPTPRVLMGVRHRDFPVYGVQFHPESVLSEAGADILANFVRIANRWNELLQRAAS